MLFFRIISFTLLTFTLSFMSVAARAELIQYRMYGSYTCVFTCIEGACTKGNVVDSGYVIAEPFYIQPGLDPVQVATGIAVNYIQKQNRPGVSCRGPDGAMRVEKLSK